VTEISLLLLISGIGVLLQATLFITSRTLRNAGLPVTKENQV
jgi:hypothetical protein